MCADLRRMEVEIMMDCFYCDAKLKSPEEYKEHVKKIHEAPCRYCGSSVPNGKYHYNCAFENFEERISKLEAWQLTKGD